MFQITISPVKLSLDNLGSISGVSINVVDAKNSIFYRKLVDSNAFFYHYRLRRAYRQAVKTINIFNIMTKNKA